MSDQKPLPAAPQLAPEFEAIASIVRNAQRGELRIPQPSDQPGSGAEPDARLPAGWYRPSPPPKKPQFGEDLLRAAGFGLVTGLVVLLPIVLWQSSTVRKLERAAASQSAKLSAAAPAPDGTLLLVTDTPTQAATDPASDDIAPILEEARQRIGAGDIIGARTVLAKSNAARNADTLFLSAETYDPNMLAAWGARGVTADPDRARALYAAANALGHDVADSRLAALR
jgi:hypothetical protein